MGFVFVICSPACFFFLFQTNLQYDFNADGTRRHENVEMNRQENYVRIYSPATEDKGDMTLIHDYNKVSGGYTYLIYQLFQINLTRSFGFE